MKQLTRIEKAEIYALKIPFKMGFTHAMASRSFSDSLILKIEGQGKRGFGEAIVRDYVSGKIGKKADLLKNAKEIIARILKPIFEKNDLWHYVDIKNELDNTITDQSCAKCALDIALLDWIGKKLNTPLYKMWGLDKSKTPLTTFSIGIDTPEVIKQKVKEYSLILST